jgi:hypothetical protein
MGRPLPPERRAKVEQAVAAHPEATQLELGRETGVSRSTVGRVVRAPRGAAAGGMTRISGSGILGPPLEDLNQDGFRLASPHGPAGNGDGDPK